MKSKEEIYRECWNNWVTSLWGKEWATDKAFEEVTPSIQHVYEAMELYAQQKLNIASVVRPEVEGAKEGGLLGNGEGKAGALEVLYIKTGQLLSVEGCGFMFAKYLNTGQIKCFNVENVSGESREGALH